MRVRPRFSFPSFPALVLYCATLAIEVPAIITRFLITAILLTLALLAAGHSARAAEPWTNLALIPTAWSILALFTPAGGGWWWRQNLGGRPPSEREQTAYLDALEQLHHNAPKPPRQPSSWFVIDTPHPDAAVNGHTLMLSRGLLESPHLPAVLAHELGHLTSSDGKLTAALNRLVIHPPPSTRDEPEYQYEHRESLLVADDRVFLVALAVRAVMWITRKIVSIAKGGLALRITAPLWAAYWRAREYTADQYAAQLGQADELADFLELHALIHDHPVPFIWLTEHTHPPTELRISRLRAAAHAHPPQLNRP